MPKARNKTGKPQVIRIAAGAQRFEAFFEPDEPDADAISENAAKIAAVIEAVEALGEARIVRAQHFFADVDGALQRRLGVGVGPLVPRAARPAATAGTARTSAGARIHREGSAAFRATRLRGATRKTSARMRPT